MLWVQNAAQKNGVDLSTCTGRSTCMCNKIRSNFESLKLIKTLLMTVWNMQRERVHFGYRYVDRSDLTQIKSQPVQSGLLLLLLEQHSRALHDDVICEEVPK